MKVWTIRLFLGLIVGNWLIDLEERNMRSLKSIVVGSLLGWDRGYNKL